MSVFRAPKGCAADVFGNPIVERAEASSSYLVKTAVQEKTKDPARCRTSAAEAVRGSLDFISFMDEISSSIFPTLGLIEMLPFWNSMMSFRRPKCTCLWHSSWCLLSASRQFEKFLHEGLGPALTGLGRGWGGLLTAACPLLFLTKVQRSLVVEEMPRRNNPNAPCNCC